ncbi:hypothetical protein [Lacticaseibacillus paracasei]|uniref:hypothetical protein n=1 Tax=Lacticaseibacillus paracasei TaxID=1597 RepID=UPI0031F6140F
MSNETKRDVFDAVWNRLAGYQVFFNGWPRETLDDYKKRYDNALPDDLPVIPKAVGCMIAKMKPICKSILDSQYRDYGKDHRWIIDHYDTFARAWLLEAWRVEETGEIVKLEAEK